jgi:hypothetical protein
MRQAPGRGQDCRIERGPRAQQAASTNRASRPPEPSQSRRESQRRSNFSPRCGRDLDEQAGTIAVTGKLVRIKGKGLVRIEDTQSDAGTRTLTVAPLHDRHAGVELGTALPR